MNLKNAKNLDELGSTEYFVCELYNKNIYKVEYNVKKNIYNASELTIEIKTKLDNLLFEYREYINFDSIEIWFIKENDVYYFIPYFKINSSEYLTVYKSLILIGLMGLNMTAILYYETNMQTFETKEKLKESLYENSNVKVESLLFISENDSYIMQI